MANGGSLRLAHGACDMDDRGAILMPGSNILTLNHASSTLQSRLADAADSIKPQESHSLLPLTNNNQSDEMDGVAFDAFSNDHDDDDGPELQWNDTAELDRASENQQLPLTMELRNRNVQQPKDDERPHDPWLMLDPHDPGTLKPCPIRIGSTYNLPPGVEGLPSDTVTGSRTKVSSKRSVSSKTKQDTCEKKPKVVDFVSIATFDSILSYYDNWMRNTPKVPAAPTDTSDNSILTTDNQPGSFFTIPKTGLIFGDEFAYIAQARKKRLKEQQRQERKLRTGKELHTAMPVEEINQQLRDLYEDSDNGSDHDFGGGFAINDDDEIHDTTSEPSNFNISLHQFNAVFGSEEKLSSESKQNDFLSFDDLCRAHLKEFARGAERYAVETQLSKRVSLWQDKLATVLEEEEQRPEFNIDSYGKSILHNVQAKCDKVHTSDSKVCFVIEMSILHLIHNSFALYCNICIVSEGCEFF
jgi:condensin-2 complex subunit H2